MLRRIFERVSVALDTRDPDNSELDRDAPLRLATAVLMVDVARADSDFTPEEFDRVVALTTRHFGLTADEAAELANRADETAEDLVSLHDFTQLLHTHLDEEQKADVVRLLWRVAFADGRLDMHEDALVLKISDLLHVSRGLVMRLKHDAAPGA